MSNLPMSVKNNALAEFSVDGSKWTFSGKKLKGKANLAKGTGLVKMSSGQADIKLEVYCE